MDNPAFVLPDDGTTDDLLEQEFAQLSRNFQRAYRVKEISVLVAIGIATSSFARRLESSERIDLFDAAFAEFFALHDLCSSVGFESFYLAWRETFGLLRALRNELLEPQIKN